MNTKHTDSVEAVREKYLQSLRSLHHATISGDDTSEYEAHLKQIEAELQATQSQQVEEAVEKERERIIAIVQTSPQAFMVSDTERRFIKAITPNHQD